VRVRWPCTAAYTSFAPPSHKIITTKSRTHANCSDVSMLTSRARRGLRRWCSTPRRAARSRRPRAGTARVTTTPRKDMTNYRHYAATRTSASPPSSSRSSIDIPYLASSIARKSLITHSAVRVQPVPRGLTRATSNFTRPRS
jgi:hypothetical protein